jgi:biotin-dependent carboxylase-like uncharacterized protein
MIKVLQAGLYTTVQDLGRFGYRNIGVPLSGAMDALSARRANDIVGNSKEKAVLEITLSGPTLKFEKSTTIAISGAPFEVMHNDTEIAMDTLISIKKNDVLHIGKAKNGMRCYLAVAGGFQTPLVLNSRSYYAHITEKKTIEKGDLLPIAVKPEPVDVENTPKINSKPLIDTLEVYPGPEYGLLTIFQQQGIMEQEFTISAQSNRMASVLECNVRLSANEILTTAVQPGTVQLTPSGKMMVLMRDAQVTGGYARIFQLTEKSINSLAQKRGGETVRFRIKRLSS